MGWCCLLDKREFLRGMRDYMPVYLREFLSFMDKTPTIQDYSKSNVMWYFICWFECNIAFYWLTWAFQSLFVVDPSVSNVTLLFIGYCLQFLVTVTTQYTTDIHMVYRRTSLWKLLYCHPCCISNSRQSALTRSIPLRNLSHFLASIWPLAINTEPSCHPLFCVRVSMFIT